MRTRPQPAGEWPWPPFGREATRRTRARRRRGPAIAAAVMALLATLGGIVHAAPGDDPFREFSDSVGSNARWWAAALLLLGTLYVGSKVCLGSNESGKHVGRYVGGAFFLVLCLKGQAILEYAASVLGMR